MKALNRLFTRLLNVTTMHRGDRKPAARPA